MCVQIVKRLEGGGLYQIAEVVEGGMIKMVAFSIMIEVKAKMGLNHGIIRR
jgi:hypothetical protein